MARIFVITSRYPYPLEKGDKLRIYNQLKYLSHYHEIHLFAINEIGPTKEQVDALSPYCTSIHTHVLPTYKRIFKLWGALFSKRPLQVQYFYSPRAKKEVVRLISLLKPNHIYCHLTRTSEYVKDLDEYSKTIDFMDCFSKGFKLKLEETRNPFLNAFYRFEYRRQSGYERSVFSKFNCHTIISYQDREAIDHPLKARIEVVPNGVDFNIFFPIMAEKKYEVMVTGNMGYGPNIDAAYFAATKVMPALLRAFPTARLLIAGVNAPSKLKRLQSGNIDVVEKFHHIRDAFAQSVVNLVPVVTSIGLQNKILQGMAMKIPTVATPAGMHGINAEGLNVMLIGNTAEELAAHIGTLLSQQEKREQLAERAFNYVRRYFDWEIHNERLLKVLFNEQFD
jgi:glycosyltransferase involved in cell wall biosynthesis